MATTTFTMNNNWAKTPMFDVDPYSMPPVPGRKYIPYQGPTYECTDDVEDLFNGLSLGEKGETPAQAAVRLGRIVYAHRGGSDDTCAICLENMKDQNAQFTPCGHGFHSRCLHAWTGESGRRSCPACRTDMYPNDLARNRTSVEEDYSTRDLVRIWASATAPLEIDEHGYSSSAEDTMGELTEGEEEHVNEIYVAWLEQQNEDSELELA